MYYYLRTRWVKALHLCQAYLTVVVRHLSIELYNRQAGAYVVMVQGATQLALNALYECQTWSLAPCMQLAKRNES